VGKGVWVAKIKIIDFTAKAFAERWTPLKEVVKKNFSVDLEVEIKIVSKDSIKSALQDLVLSDANCCRIDPEFASAATEHFQTTTMEVSLSESAGILIRDEKKWWPKSFYDEAFSRMASEHIGQIDINGSALVVGASGSAKLVAASLVKMGFVTVNIVEEDPVLGEATVKNLRKRFFNVKFQYVPGLELTTLPGVNSIVVNTNPLTETDEIYPELHFFNFLKNGGVVVDLTLVPSRTPLIIEAEKWGARYISGDVLASTQDVLMIEYLLKKKIEDIDSYCQSLRALIDAVPFDPSPYLKQFQDRGL
jgi:shikimate 5-dehydrogenase